MSKYRIHAARSAARAKAFQVLYSFTFAASASPEALRAAYMHIPDMDDAGQNMLEDVEKMPDTDDFAWNLVQGVREHTAALDSIIAGFSTNWNFERLGKVEIVLLRLALFEMLYSTIDIPPKVAVNEVLDLCNMFGDEKEKSFINGILNAALKALDNGELHKETSSGQNSADPEQKLEV